MNDELQKVSFQMILDNRNSNLTGEFVNEFATEIKLSRNMEVALAEIRLPNTASSTTENMKFELIMGFANFDNPQWDREEILLKSVEIPSKTFTSNEDFIKSITELVRLDIGDLQNLIDKEDKSKFMKSPKESKIFYDGKSLFVNKPAWLEFDGTHFVNDIGYIVFSRKKFKELNKIIYWKFNDKIKRLLGFQPIDIYENFNNNKPIKAIYPFDLFEKLSAIYIYSDVVKTSHIGETKANVLRVICMDEKSKIYNKKFENLIFIPLRTKNITSIGISIRDLMGDILKFQNIKNNEIPVSVTLLFRPLEYF